MYKHVHRYSFSSMKKGHLWNNYLDMFQLFNCVSVPISNLVKGIIICFFFSLHEVLSYIYRVKPWLARVYSNHYYTVNHTDNPNYMYPSYQVIDTPFLFCFFVFCFIVLVLFSCTRLYLRWLGFVLTWVTHPTHHTCFR